MFNKEEKLHCIILVTMRYNFDIDTLTWRMALAVNIRDDIQIVMRAGGVGEGISVIIKRLLVLLHQ